MKALLVLASIFHFILGFHVQAFPPSGADWEVSERGPDHRKWTRAGWTTNQFGILVRATNTVVELGTGLHRDLTGQWTLTQPRIEPATNGAVCVGARHSAWLSRNLNTRAAILIRTPEGNWLKANVLGLAYYDAASGRSVTIARLQNCVGEIVGTNQVIYRDAFAEFRCDVRYTYSRAGLEQDVILRQSPPSPEVWGLNPATTRLLVLTEFLDTPAPARVAQDASLTGTQTNLLAAMTARLAGMTNQAEKSALLAKWRGMVARAHEREAMLDFGGMRVVGGRAFQLATGTNEPSVSSLANSMASGPVNARLKAAVRKEWRRIGGRDFLIERVNLKEIREQLQKLPQTAQQESRKSTDELRQEVSDTLQVPGPLLAAAVPSRPMLVAQLELEKPGFVLDWNMVPASYTDFTFEAGTTYIVSEDCYLDGTTTIQDGAVIKFAAGGWSSLHIAGPVICPASGAAYFTSTEDDSVGEAVSLGYGLSGGAMYGTALDIDGWSAGPCLLQNLDFRYGWAGVALNGDWGASVAHLLNNCNFTDCHDALVLNGTRVRMNGGGISLNSGYCSNEAISGNDYHLTLVAAALAGYPLVAADGRDPGSSQSSLVILQDCSVSGEITTSGPVVVAVNPPVVSVTATDIQATKGTTDTAAFAVMRTGDTSQDLYVESTSGGNAVENVDYTGIPHGFTIPAGQENATFTVTAGTANANGLGSATATLQLLEMPSAWLVEPPGEDTVFITDPSAPAYPAPLGVVAWWRGQGNAQDSVGTNHGTLSQGGFFTSAGYESGMVGDAFRFYNANAGSSSDPGAHVHVTDSAGLKPAAVTVEAWVKFTEADTQNNPWPGRQVIAAKPGLNGVDAYVLRKEGDRFNFAVGSAAGAQVAATSTTVLQLNRWYHVAGSYDPAVGEVRLYVDGVLQDTQAASFALGYGSGPLFIGIKGYEQPYSFAPLCGLVDEVTLYARALTANEVAAIHGIASRGKTYDPLDKDADLLPDAWELAHFGNLSQSGGGDFDGDGISNGDEQVAGTDPNTIEFRLEFSFDATRFNSATGAIEVLRGVPAQMAVLVDSTNFSAASWASFSTNLTFNLGATDGWHEVWVGLKGQPQSAGYAWEWKRIRLDQTPPVLVITNPAGGTLTQPMIQLQGYSPESLASISCDLSNAAGVFTNQMTLVLDRYHDTNTWEFTTNEFQVFDVDLTNGMNLFTVRATDLAGNSTETNFSFTLASDTVAPVISVEWPLNGAKLVGDTFLVNGTTDDPTAKLTLSLQGTNGVAKPFKALVERTGKFWVENLPLDGGANWLTLTATDAWGNTIATNFSVIKNLVTATMNPVPADQLWQDTVSVSGTVSDASHAVWVNGVAATVNSDGTWMAVDVPVNREGGTATFEFTVYPPDEAPTGGGGGGGSGGGSGTLSANPFRPNAAPGKGATELPDELYVASDEVDLRSDRFERQDFVAGDWVTWENGYRQGHKWARQAGSPGWMSLWLAIKSSGWPDESATTIGNVLWPASLKPDQSRTWIISPRQITGGWFENPPTIGDEHCAVKSRTGWFSYSGGDSDWWTLDYTRHAQTRRKLFTGGKALPKRNSLFVVPGAAFEIMNKYALPPLAGAPKRAIAGPRITMGELGNLGADGLLWIVLPNGISKDVTPTVEGVNYYWFTAQHNKFPMTNLCHSPIPANRDRTDLGVGERVDISFVNLPAQPPVFRWSATAGGLSATSGPGITYTAPSNGVPATVTATVKGQKCTIDFEVKEPTGVADAQIVSTTGQYIPPDTAGAWMQMNVTLGPTNVSFYRVEVWEPARAATSVTGYFTSHWPKPHDKLAHAEEWHPVGYDNKINLGGKFDTCRYWGDENLPGPSWSPGGDFTWPIPASWTVGRMTSNSLPWSDQVFHLESDGTFTILKFGKTVTRTVQNVIIPNL